VTVELKVAGMTCGDCVRAVTTAIQARDPAAKVEVSLEQGIVRAMTSLPRSEVAAAVEEEGYKVAS
jgi:copper chaperone